MKPLFKIYLLILAVAIASCHKQLNVFPTTSEVDGNVIVDKQSAKTALNGVYYLFANAGFDVNQNPSILWCSVNEMPPSELSGLIAYPFGGVPLADHTYVPSTPGVGGIWDYGYKIVNAVNGFLKNIEPVAGITASDKQEMTAEVKFLRAYANAELLFFYGQYDDVSSQYGIILRKDFVSSNNIVQPRSGVKDCYDFILDDLDDAIAGLPGLNSDIVYANVWDAQLLKARVLMVRGTGSDYADVVDLCKHIITSSPFALETNTKDIFLSKGLSSNEVMLGIKPYDNDAFKYTQYIQYYEGVGTDTLVSLLANDPRRDWVYQTIDNPYLGGNMYTFTKYFPGAADDPSPVAVANVCYAMRLTEAYLLEAEAIIASGGSMNDAKALLKEVMQHAGFTDFSQVDAAGTPEAVQLLIVKEEMKNFVGEAGQDWLAVRRLPFATLQQLIPTIQNKTQLVLPIPQDEMTRNTALKGMQNPGYGGN